MQANPLIVPDDLLSAAQTVISEFGLLKTDEPAILALSGGKDSITAMLVLRELGYSLVPVVIDMGYEMGWADRVRNNARRFGIECKVLNVRANRFRQQLNEEARPIHDERLRVLDSIGANPKGSASPCTQCYNTKIDALRLIAYQHGVGTVIFGQHATDAVVSLLKSALMYIDRWDRAHERFVRSNFEALVTDFSDEIDACMTHGTTSALLTRVETLASSRLATTDEPPAQLIEPSASNEPPLRLVRPLFSVLEHLIIRFSFETGLLPEGSGCGHGATAETESPREMIHFRILRKLEDTRQGRTLIHSLGSWVRYGLTAEGLLVFHARNARAQLLGPQYRAGLGCGTKL